MENAGTAKTNNVATTLQVPERLCRLKNIADFNPYEGDMASYDGEGWNNVTSDDEDVRESIGSMLRAEVRERTLFDNTLHRKAFLGRSNQQDCPCLVCLGCQRRHISHLPQQQQAWVCVCVPPKVCACTHCSGQLNYAKRKRKEKPERNDTKVATTSRNAPWIAKQH